MGPVWASIHSGCHTWKMFRGQSFHVKAVAFLQRATCFMIKTNMEITPENDDMDLLDICCM